MRSISACGLVSLAVLVGCSDVTGPVVALGPNGAKMTGTATGRINGVGDIVISGPYGRCVGNYDSLDTSPTIPISLLCEDGTSTIGSATRTLSGQSGSGTMTDSRGRTWQFVFGESATALF